VLLPFPAQISQSEPQYIRFDDYLHYYSVYPTAEQQTDVQLPSTKIESYTKIGALVKGDMIEYGPFEDIVALSPAPLMIHFNNDSPFVTMTSMKKLIEVSHFGNINVEEWYQLQHTGASLKGPFSRYEYQRNAKGASFRSITAILPLHSSDLYYRDQIGNVSTSHVRETEERIEFEVLPRFPMFGGWQTDFYIGYNLPASKYLSTAVDDSSTYVLTISFGSPFPQAAIDEEEIHVILPEFAKSIQWVTPFEVESASFDTHVTYLDTVGRPVLVLTKKNVMRLHDRPFQVMYKYSKVFLLQEPFIIFLAFFLFFLLSMVYVRIDLSITDSTDKNIKSQREGHLGQVMNKILGVVSQALVSLSSLQSERIEDAIDRLSDLKGSVEQLKKDKDCNAAADRLDNNLNQLKTSAKKFIRASPDAVDRERTKLRQKIDELRLLQNELSTL